MMSGRELDADCARRLGLDVVTDYATVYGEHAAISWWIGEINDESATPVLNYSSDPSAAQMLEDEIERRGLQARYATFLLEEVDPDGAQIYHSAIEVERYTSPHDDGWKLVWALIRATPEQRARAFLAATEGL
jgi:hypothetical protein